MSRAASRAFVLGVPSGAPPLASYQFVTANDNARRDPTSWTLQLQTTERGGGKGGGGNNGGAGDGGGDGGAIWRTIDVAEGVEPPDGRREAYAMRSVHPEGLHEAVIQEEEPGR